MTATLPPREPLMAGDSNPQVQTPLTTGFAPTGFEQEQQNSVRPPAEEASK